MKVETVACNWCGIEVSEANFSHESGEANQEEQSDICIECLTRLAEKIGLTSPDHLMIQMSSATQVTSSGRHKDGVWGSYLERLALEGFIRYFSEDDDMPLERLASRASGALSTYRTHHSGKDFRSIKAATSVFIIRIK